MTTLADVAATQRPWVGRAADRARRVQPGVVLAVVFLALVALAALVPDVLAPTSPTAADPASSLQPPSPAHWFGTDVLGRDLFARVVHGAWLSVSAGVLAVAISLSVGSAIGVVAGAVGGWVDGLLMRVVDVMVALPGLLLSLAFVSILGFGVVNVAIAVGIAGIPAFARLVRSETLRVVGRPYVDAARLAGVGGPVLLARHVVPNASGSVLVLAALEVGGAILSVSALSFLGFVAVPPTPEWGSLVAEGRMRIDSAWWLTTFPGAAIAATVLATNRLSRAVRIR